jgi:hypothetical protein
VAQTAIDLEAPASALSVHMSPLTSIRAYAFQRSAGQSDPVREYLQYSRLEGIATGGCCLYFIVVATDA